MPVRGWHIEAAASASEAPRPPIDSWADKSDSLLITTRGEGLFAALEREAARWYVRRLANQHDCVDGRCTRPEHKRDATAIVPVWDALGLLRTMDEKRTVPAPTSRPAARRLVQVLSRMEWAEQGSCRKENPDLFSPESETNAEARRQIEKAKTICGACPVRTQCLKWAVDRKEFGVWGGTTDKERESMRRSKARKRRGRAA